MAEVPEGLPARRATAVISDLGERVRRDLPLPGQSASSPANHSQIPRRSRHAAARTVEGAARRGAADLRAAAGEEIPRVENRVRTAKPRSVPPSQEMDRQVAAVDSGVSA